MFSKSYISIFTLTLKTTLTLASDIVTPELELLNNRLPRAVSPLDEDTNLELERLENQALAEYDSGDNFLDSSFYKISDKMVDQLIGDYLSYDLVDLLDDFESQDDDFFGSDVVFQHEQSDSYFSDNNYFDMDYDNSFERIDRASGFNKKTALHINRRVPMCNSQMNTIYRQTRMAATLLLNNNKGRNFSQGKRLTRAAFNKSIMRKNPGDFCRTLHKKLKIVYTDVLLIEDELEKKYGNNHVQLLKQTLKQLKESLQEQMNRYGISYKMHNFDTIRRKKELTARNINSFKTRAETTIDALVSTLGNLNTGCQRLRRSIALKYKNGEF